MRERSFFDKRILSVVGRAQKVQKFDLKQTSGLRHVKACAIQHNNPPPHPYCN